MKKQIKCEMCKTRNATQTALLDVNELWDICDSCKAQLMDNYFEAQMEGKDE